MKTMPTTIPASKARSNFYTLLDDVSNKLKRYVITRRGRAQVVMMHPDEVASWEETMEILSNSILIKEIAQAEKELSKGKVISEKELINKLGISEADLS